MRPWVQSAAPQPTSETSQSANTDFIREPEADELVGGDGIGRDGWACVSYRHGGSQMVKF